MPSQLFPGQQLLPSLITSPLVASDPNLGTLCPSTCSLSSLISWRLQCHLELSGPLDSGRNFCSWTPDFPGWVAFPWECFSFFLVCPVLTVRIDIFASGFLTLLQERINFSLLWFNLQDFILSHCSSRLLIYLGHVSATVNSREF